MRGIRYLAAVASFVSALPLAANAATWSMTSPYPDRNLNTVIARQFAESVKGLSGGELEIKFFGAGSLFKYSETKNAVQTGTVEIGMIILNDIAPENIVFEMDSLPFLATSYDQARVLWNVSRRPIEKILQSQGLMALFAIPYSPQGIFSKKPLDSISDFSGLKIHAPSSAARSLAEMVEAVPLTTPAHEIPLSLATGQIDAVVTSPLTGEFFKLWQEVSYYTHVSAWIPKNLAVMNAKAFSKLPANVQKNLRDAGSRTEELAWRTSETRSNESISILQKNGIKINYPSDEFKKALHKLGGKIILKSLSESKEEGRMIFRDFILTYNEDFCELCQCCD